MWTSVAVIMVAAILCAGASFWVLRAYRRAGGGSRSGRSAMLACAAVAVVALATYLAVGRPELPDAPYRQRLDALIAALRSPNPPAISPDEQLAVWTHFARERPREIVPHVEAAKLLLALGRFREAAIEFDRALQLQPVSPEALLGMGRALTMIDGRVSPEALRYFQQAGELSVDPAPWLYQARAAMESGRDADARRFWAEAARRMPASDPMREMAERMSRGERP